ncbi:MAG: hypothetical protein NVS2B4_22420 [Ramlibacter sp.]
MKYLLVIAVVWVAFWLWRQGRRVELRQHRPPAAPPPPPPPGLPQAMVQCAHCGAHLPASEAVKGGRASYCSAAHRQAAGD